MANWINFNVVGGSNADGSVLAPEQDGDNLLLAESVIGISTNTSATALAVVMQLTGGLTATALVSTSPDAADAPEGGVPVSAGYAAKVKGAVNRALTGNPGGVKSNCVLPQDQADNTAPYDPALKVYWRSFVVA
tara:strand:+ start:6075 stop:6476 length:402 start_codon:yes stop_codon:yes gene_type:complete